MYVTEEKSVSIQIAKVSNAGKEIISEEEVVFDSMGAAHVSIPVTELPELGEELIMQVRTPEKVYFTQRIAPVEQKKIVDIIMVAGQSNALGQGGDKALSIKPELDTVYYQTMGNTTLSTEGNIGWDSALGKTWHDLTGHTVLIVKAAFGGTGFPSLPGTAPEWGSDAFGYWNPDNTATGSMNCYKMAKDRYAAAVASIDTNEYTIGRCMYFWNQGENENDFYNAKDYYEAFMELHNAFVTEFGTDSTRLTYGGLMAVRSTYANGFPNLTLTGPRTAQYYMGNNEENIFIVTDATEHWSTDAKIVEYFRTKYEDREYPWADMPDSWGDIMNTDNVHYKQLAMNEMGEEAAISMLAQLEQENEADGIRIVTQTGIEYYSDGDSIYLNEDGGIPIIDPAIGEEFTYTVSGNTAFKDDFGVIIPKASVGEEYSVLNVVTESGKEMSFKLFSPIEMISIAKIKDNCEGAYTLSVDDGNAYTAKFLDQELRANNMTASMVLVPGWIGIEDTIMTWEEAQTLVNCDDTVWSVVNHTMNHVSSFESSKDEALIESEINGSRALLKEKFPNQRILSIVTPGGAKSDLIAKAVKSQHLGWRGTGGGNMAIPENMEDFYSIKCNPVGVYYNTTLEQMNSWIDNAIANGQWCVEMWHGVDDDQSSWGGNIAGDIAKSHISYAAEKMNAGKLWVTSMDDMIVYTAQRLNAKVEFVSNDGNVIKFKLISDLTGKDYETELTVNIALPEGWSDAETSVDGQTVDYVTADGVLTVNVKVNGGIVSVAKK